MREIDSALLAKIEKRQQTLYENAAPSLRVVSSRGLTTEMFLVYTIQEGTTLEMVDISVKRPFTESLPAEAYALTMDNGTAKVKKRTLPYDERDEWEDDFTVASGVTAGAIAFDGYWVRDMASLKFNLVTEDTPWVFTVVAGTLSAQYGEGTPVSLATDVVEVAAIRGWIPAEGTSANDQGLVVAYTKTDGLLYYRNYCMQGSGNKAWEVEHAVPDAGSAVASLTIFRTNDFRVGICWTANNSLQWLLTERNWSGVAAPLENVHGTLSIAEVKLTTILYTDLKVTEHVETGITFGKVNFCPFEAIVNFVPTIIRAKRMDDYLIELEYDTDLHDVPDCPACFTISNNSVVAVAKAGTRILQLTTANPLVSVGSWTVTYNGLGGINHFHSDYCKPEFGSFSVLATGEPPSVTEAIAATLGLTSVNFIQCTFSDLSREERVSGTLAIGSVELIKVGTNPL